MALNPLAVLGSLRPQESVSQSGTADVFTHT